MTFRRCENCDFFVGGDCTVEVPFFDSEHYLDGSNEFACHYWRHQGDAEEDDGEEEVLD